MNIISIIPARGGSKSIPRKNIKLLNGKPLISYSIKTSLACGLRTIVNSDSQEYLDISKQYGAETMLRPSNLAQDSTSMLELLQSEVFKVKPLPDLVVLLQPTSPFRRKLIIKTAITLLEKNFEEYDSVVSVERVPEKYNPYAMIVQTPTGNNMLFRKLIGWKEKFHSLFTGKKYKGASLSGYPINQRVIDRHNLPQTWLPDGNVYVFKSSNLKKGSIYGDKTMLIENSGTININSEEDFQKAEEYLKSKDDKV